MKDKVLPDVILLPGKSSVVRPKMASSTTKPEGLFLEWLENKEYVKTDYLIHDRKYMQQTVDTHRHQIPANIEEHLSFSDVGSERMGEILQEDTESCRLSSVDTQSDGDQTVDAEFIEPNPDPPPSQCASLDASLEQRNASPAEGTHARMHAHTTPAAPAAPAAPQRSVTPPKNPIPPVVQNQHPLSPDDDQEDREMLIKQLDVLRMRFKQATIPANAEGLKVDDIRRIVSRNVAQLKRNRNVATYKLGMVAVLLVLELVFARLCKVDVTRFMQWHYANMQSYEEILVELGEMSSPMTESSPMTQLCMLMFFNSALFVGNELMLKYFSVDVLNVMSSITGAQMPVQPQKPEPETPSFAANFSRFMSG